MRTITFRAGKKKYVIEVDETAYEAPDGVEQDHFTRPVTIEGDDLDTLGDHFLALVADELAEDEDCPSFLQDCGPEGCTISVELA